MPQVLSTRDPGFAAAFTRLVEARRETAADVDTAVATIVADVARRGDDALFDYTRRFDEIDLAELGVRLSRREIADGAAAAPAETVAALRFAAERIESYHRRQLPEPIDYADALGVRLAARWRPIDAVGLYVPGGTAAYPSSVLMNAIPAKIAGVGRLAMTVPAPGGRVNPLVLAAAELLGIDEIYRVGGAQAVAALAYGTATIAAVDKIVGPGNAYVAAAKRQVFGRVGIDMIAGPSEILVVADGRNDPAWIAADLLSQAEHDTAAQAVLITVDHAFAALVEAAVERHLARLSRAATARASWEANGAVVIVGDWEEAPALIDRIAPEHLELALDDAVADALAAQVSHAGAIFLGRWAPEAIGDYLAGPNHVLPTARRARFSSGLGVLDFMKRTSLVRCDPKNFAALAPVAISLAEAEGLDAHALSLSIRLGGQDAAAPGTRTGSAAVDKTQRIATITLDEHTVVRRNADIEHERTSAITDLLENNSFAPASGRLGPFDLHLAIEENRLNFVIRSTSDGSSETVVLPLAPFRRIVKDYFIVCESYYQAVRDGRLGQVEAIDMGRRGLHNEGSTLLMERLADKVALDHDTARRLFTLICVLHLRG
jgi:histidinol dehydrogenase